MRFLSHLAALLATTLPAHSLNIRGYNATVHDRFTGFPANPVMNPNFLYDATKFTGVGWWYGLPGGTTLYQLTLVTPRHALCALHAQPPTGTVLNFIDSAGNLVQRTATSKTAVANDDSGLADLCVVTLSAPVPATVATYPWLNLSGGEAAYTGQNLMVLGGFPGGTPRAGQATLIGFETYDTTLTITETRCSLFHYITLTGAPDDCTMAGGDSGGPSFADVSGQPALVATHLGVLNEFLPGVNRNVDTFLPHYVTRVDAILAPSGHRLRPVHFTPTTLALPGGVPAPGTLRRRNPGAIAFSLENTGSELTGNLTLTISFPAGQQPDSLSAPGWVVESGGTGVWHLRKATLAGMASQSFTANWAALPDLAAVGCTVDADSDTAAPVQATPSFSLAPSYAQWAHGLAQPAQTADPDADMLPNLVEYALGGDAESGAMELPGGHPLQPVLSQSGGTVSFSFPERDDAELRGISYIVETTTDLASPWSGTLPAGAASGTSPYVPAVPGFVKRTVTWPADGPRRFVRVKVELGE